MKSIKYSRDKWGKPYFCKTINRWMAAKYHEGKKTKTVYYSRCIMELYLNRDLETWEHVHHINKDTTDDRISNLCLTTETEHIEKYHSQGKTFVVCPECKKTIEVLVRDVNKSKRYNMSGPFCSRICSGKTNIRKRWKK